MKKQKVLAKYSRANYRKELIAEIKALLKTYFINLYEKVRTIRA